MNVAWGENLFQQMQQVMDVLGAQHRVIANNIANVNTPAYTKMQVDFNHELERLLSASGETLELQPVRSVPRDLLAACEARPEITPVPDSNAPARPDGNNVNMEKEMVELAQANEAYSALTRIASKTVRITRYVISGGKG